MPLKHRFYEPQKLILTTWSGEITDTELIRFYMGIYNNSQWQPGFNEITDLRDARIENVSDETMIHLSELATNCLGGEKLKLALIAPSELSLDIARLYKAFTHVPNESTKVFHHMNDAMEWLA